MNNKNIKWKSINEYELPDIVSHAPILVTNIDNQLGMLGGWLEDIEDNTIITNNELSPHWQEIDFKIVNWKKFVEKQPEPNKIILLSKLDTKHPDYVDTYLVNIDVWHCNSKKYFFLNAEFWGIDCPIEHIYWQYAPLDLSKNEFSVDKVYKYESIFMKNCPRMGFEDNSVHSRLEKYKKIKF